MFLGHRCEELFLRNKTGVPGEGSHHRLGTQRPVVNARLEHPAGQHPIAAGSLAVAHPEYHLRITGLVLAQRILAEGSPVRFTVAIACDLSVCVIHDGQMHRPFERLIFLWSIEIIGSTVVFAPGQPAATLFFCVDDGVEIHPIPGLHGDDSAAFLAKIT